MKNEKVGTALVELIILLILISFIAIAADVVKSFFSNLSFFLSTFLASMSSYFKVFSSVVAMIALVIAIYSFIRISEISSEENKKLGLVLNWDSEKKQKNERWERVEQYMASPNPSDWKIAVLEADNILDQVVERMGYRGNSLGERLRQIEASDFPYLNEAWQAHKTRNAIAHKGTNYEISRSDAEQTINIYNRIFKELGYL